MFNRENLPRSLGLLCALNEPVTLPREGVESMFFRDPSGNAPGFGAFEDLGGFFAT